MRRIAVALATIPALLAAPAHAKPIRLEPSSDWQLREYDDKCRMIRTFGKGEDETTLWIDKGGPGPTVNLTLIGRPVRSPYGAYIRVAFAPGDPVDRNFITATSSKGRPVLGLFGVEPVSQMAEQAEVAAPAPAEDKGEESVDLVAATPAQFASVETLQKRYAAITALELSGAVIDPITLELDDVFPMADQLLTCTTQLSKRLSRNPAEEGGLAKPATTVDEAMWAMKIQENYPAHLLRAEQQGTVAVRLTVDKQGRASFCEVTGYSGPVSFNETACLQLLRHARFDPARDASGAPVASFYATRITYRLNK
jgi:TonB family protein